MISLGRGLRMGEDRGGRSGKGMSGSGECEIGGSYLQ